MALPETRTIDTLRRTGAAFPRLHPAGQRPEIRATYLLFPSSPPREWHPAIPSREPLREISPYIRATAGSKIFPYRPASCTKRVSIEAGVTGLWWKYVGTEGKVIGIDRFGLSAPGNLVMKELGMTAESVVKAAG